MRFFLLCCFAAFSVLSIAPHAAARDFTGYGFFLTNDAFASVSDDRWRTGGGALSFAWGPQEDLLELRLRAEVITPGNLVRPAATDRPYAAALSVGAHRHFRFGQTEVSFGGDLVLTGAQTGLDGLQAAIHDLIGVAPPSAATLATYIPNGLYGAATAEVGHRIMLGERAVLRPFAEAQVGVENLLRVGGDLHFGRLARDEVMIRDVSSGHRYRVGQHQDRGWAAVLGGDIAYVSSSVFLPANGGPQLTDTRSRVRAGLHWQGKGVAVFYGVSWLSKEFTTQRETQVIGGLSVDFRF